MLACEAPVPYVDTVKYLGVFINSRTNCVDPSEALRKFFGCFNNKKICQFMGMANTCITYRLEKMIFIIRLYVALTLSCESFAHCICMRPRDCFQSIMFFQGMSAT